MAVPAGQKVLAGLIEKSDVVIDNFKLGTLAEMGLHRCLVRGPCAARGALLDHRLRLQRPQGGAAGL